MLSDFKVFKASTCFFHWSSSVFICLSKALPKGEYVNFVCSIICCWLDGNISSPVKRYAPSFILSKLSPDKTPLNLGSSMKYCLKDKVELEILWFYFMLWYLLPGRLTPFPKTFNIKGNANNGRIQPSYPFPVLMAFFPDIALIKKETASWMNEGAI